ncbi:serine--tRNA ligase [archaeon]|nr:serine--tRNA ligase [archaeon]
MHKDVPNGNDERDNPVIKQEGDIIRKSSESHEEILNRLGLLDIASAAKTAGARFYYLKGDLVLLEQSLLRFALDELANKGFIPISPPYLLRKRYYRNVVSLDAFEESLYAVSEPSEASDISEYEKLDDELFLIATAEHPLAAMHAETVFSGKELPLKYVGISPCFRREAGSHGKDTKGIFRVHQFNKVEQFIFSDEDNSWKYHKELLENEEEIMRKLKLPYRIIEICTGDISKRDARSFDVEVWMPSQKGYRELFSCSNCTDWQSMRLDIKYDKDGKRRYVHTLNATGLSAERMLVAIVENYVNDDGTIRIPDVLIPYMGKNIIGNV